MHLNSQQLHLCPSTGTEKKSSLLESPLTARSLRAQDYTALGDSKIKGSEKK